jgi:hypothetical protein
MPLPAQCLKYAGVRTASPTFTACEQRPQLCGDSPGLQYHGGPAAEVPASARTASSTLRKI